MKTPCGSKSTEREREREREIVHREGERKRRISSASLGFFWDLLEFYCPAGLVRLRQGGRIQAKVQTPMAPQCNC